MENSGEIIFANGNEKRNEKNEKIDGLFSTIDTLLEINKGENARKYAVLTFCEMVLGELKKTKEGNELLILENDIRNLREAVKISEVNESHSVKLDEILERLKDLSN